MSPAPSITDADRKVLQRAQRTLETPGLVGRLGDLIGSPLEIAAGALPEGTSEVVSKAIADGLQKALQTALDTMAAKTRESSRGTHKAMAAASGAVGGVFGLAALPIELPVTMVILLRSIADIARSHGEDLNDPKTAIQCVSVLALGGRSADDESAASGYLALRAILAASSSQASQLIAERGGVGEGSPILLHFLTDVASRFGVVVTQKAAAQMIPVVAAIGGAALNYAFTQHFQEIADAHFAIRALERKHGEEAILREYEALR